MARGQWSDLEFAALPSIAVAAHELKSPLAVMRQLSLMLEDGALDEAESRQAARQLTTLADRSLNLVQDLSRAANLSPTLFPLEPVNPLAVCQAIAFEIKPMMDLYGHSVHWPKHSSTKLVVANQLLLGRILANFLQNSVKYSEQKLPIQVAIKRVGDVVRLSVRDFGPMMTTREYRKIISNMEAKKSVRTRPESSGLGIYVAAQFARAMDGRIGLIRHRDGLTFYVELPISRQLSLV